MAHPDQTHHDSPTSAAGEEAQPLAVDALVEDVSIDGMCGVY